MWITFAIDLLAKGIVCVWHTVAVGIDESFGQPFRDQYEGSKVQGPWRGMAKNSNQWRGRGVSFCSAATYPIDLLAKGVVGVTAMY